MDVPLLRTFLAAADAGSFVGAAQRIHASPSSVTERIKQLEHRLGVRLFERSKKGCSLTPAGKKFLAPASRALWALEVARREVGFPDIYTRSISLGGQYVLWEGPLMTWLADIRDSIPDLAMRVSAGASARLSRDLAEGLLDITVLYDPVFRRDIATEPLFDDQLVLVTGGKPDDWQANYVQIEWGRGLTSEIGSRLDLIPESGLVLDLGGRSAQWLIAQRMAGYMPRRAVAHLLNEGKLRVVEGTPIFDYPAYICWRRDVDQNLAKAIAKSLAAVY